MPIALMQLHGVEDGIIPYADPWDWKRSASVGPIRSIPSLVGAVLDGFVEPSRVLGCATRTTDGLG